MGLFCKRNEGETWREAVARIAGEYGLESECLSEFDICVAAGESEGQAAWSALYEWDCLDYRDDDAP